MQRKITYWIHDRCQMESEDHIARYISGSSNASIIRGKVNQWSAHRFLLLLLLICCIRNMTDVNWKVRVMLPHTQQYTARSPLEGREINRVLTGYFFFCKYVLKGDHTLNTWQVSIWKVRIIFQIHNNIQQISIIGKIKQVKCSQDILLIFMHKISYQICWIHDGCHLESEDHIARYI